MFTGLVQSVGKVVERTSREFGAGLVVEPGEGWEAQPAAGDSIAVSGCCLTHAPAAGDSGGRLTFDVIAETLRKTKLGELGVGSRVNLEPCLRPTDRIGGHFVQGHVDGLGTVERVEAGSAEHRVRVRVGEGLIRYIVPTGSIAVDGVSLTVASVEAERGAFEVALIPTTLERTTLGELKAGDAVNIEGDVLVKAVVHTVERQGGGASAAGGVTLDHLRRAGFVE